MGLGVGEEGGGEEVEGPKGPGIGQASSPASEAIYPLSTRAQGGLPQDCQLMLRGLCPTAVRAPTQEGEVPPPLPRSTLYLVSGRKVAPTLVPRDNGLGLPSDHTVQIQSLPFDHRRG